jgi:hypothetical protein
MKKDFFLGREKMVTYLSEMVISNDDVTVSLYLTPGLTREQIENEVNAVTRINKSPDLIETIISSTTGACLFIGTRTTLVLPPFPIKESIIFQGLEISILESSLKTNFLIGVILLRLGAYAVAVCHGETIVQSKVGTGLVHSRHRQGGSSAQRFRRHREKQIETFLTRVCEHIKNCMGLYIEKFDYTVFGGATTTIELLDKQCPVLRKMKGRSLPPLLDIPDPRQYVLESAIRRIWSSYVIEWHDEDNPILGRHTGRLT